LPICACFAAERQGAWISTVVVPETPWEDGDGVTQLAVVRSTALHDSSVFIAVEDHGGNGHVHDEGRRNAHPGNNKQLRPRLAVRSRNHQIGVTRSGSDGGSRIVPLRGMSGCLTA
jgi:hypothetical protein